MLSDMPPTFGNDSRCPVFELIILERNGFFFQFRILIYILLLIIHKRLPLGKFIIYGNIITCRRI